MKQGTHKAVTIKRPPHTSKKAAPQCMRCSPIFVYENDHWFQFSMGSPLRARLIVLRGFFRGDLLKRYRQNTGESRQTEHIRP